MVMLRAAGKAQKIAKKVMKGKGIEVRKQSGVKKSQLQTPYLQH